MRTRRTGESAEEEPREALGHERRHREAGRQLWRRTVRPAELRRVVRPAGDVREQDEGGARHDEGQRDLRLRERAVGLAVGKQRQACAPSDKTQTRALQRWIASY